MDVFVFNVKKVTFSEVKTLSGGTYSRSLRTETDEICFFSDNQGMLLGMTEPKLITVENNGSGVIPDTYTQKELLTILRMKKDKPDTVEFIADLLSD